MSSYTHWLPWYRWPEVWAFRTWRRLMFLWFLVRTWPGLPRRLWWLGALVLLALPGLPVLVAFIVHHLYVAIS